MATGTITVHEGMQRLDSLYGGDSLLAKAYVYVPKKCVGKRRSPLLVILHGSGWRFGSSAAKILQQSADSNGVILLAPTSFSEDEGWGDTHSATPPNVDVPRIDASIGAVLRHYAIDPERIALIGSSAGAGAAMTWGYVNGDVFKLVIIDSGFGPERGEHQFDGLKGHGNPKFYIVSNTAEASILSPSAHLLQRAGYSTTFVQDPYLHGLNRERAVEQFAWLVKNWR
jgi:poly(3-hydroxybutyrate) depolymerase